MTKLQCKRQIHRGWLDFQNALMRDPSISSIEVFRQWQYIYSYGDVKISLIQFARRMYFPSNWEIYQVAGKPQLLEDVERFHTRADAEKRIKELFGIDDNNES